MKSKLLPDTGISLSFSVQDGQTFVFEDIPQPFGIGPDEQGKSHTRVLQLGQDYIRRDRQGSWSVRSQFNMGLGIFGATQNDSPIPDGEFFSWLGQVQRVQSLNEKILVDVSLESGETFIFPLLTYHRIK